MQIFVAILLGLALCANSAYIKDGQLSEKLHITILYESLCPDSSRFITQQLHPAYAGLQDYIQIEYVPFGKSDSHNGGEYFTCQHGAAECDLNVFQSCSLLQVQNQPAVQETFVACQMQSINPNIDNKCPELITLSRESIQKCIQAGTGKQLQLQAEAITKSYAPRFIPTIVYNGVFNQKLQDRSLSEFKKVVCELIHNAAPAC